MRSWRGACLFILNNACTWEQNWNFLTKNLQTATYRNLPTSSQVSITVYHQINHRILLKLNFSVAQTKFTWARDFQPSAQNMSVNVINAFHKILEHGIFPILNGLKQKFLIPRFPEIVSVVRWPQSPLALLSSALVWEQSAKVERGKELELVTSHHQSESCGRFISALFLTAT